MLFGYLQEFILILLWHSDVFADSCINFRKAENLKKELTRNGRNGLIDTGDKTSSRSALQDLYRKILITNLEYALDKKVEQEL